MNSKGIPIPLVRLDGKPTFSGTLVLISFCIWIVSIVGKWAGKLGGIDSGQCMEMFGVCCGLYWGRGFQKSDKGVILNPVQSIPSNASVITQPQPKAD